jgi:hypothetical protein
MAHIHGAQPGSNRYDASQTPSQRDDYSNLILLCPTHHTIIDQKQNEEKYTAKILLEMKAAHETYVFSKLEAKAQPSRSDTARQIAPLLAENREAWRRFGPLSDIARKNPHSDGAYAAWTSERLSTIVPNNRRICEILRVSQGNFTNAEQQIIASFLIHSRSYEQWVEDKISYEGVLQFPLEFDDLINGDANVGP